MGAERRGRRPKLLILASLIGLGFLHCGIRRDEVECEEAVKHLEDCCDTSTALQCTYNQSCDADGEVPDFTPTQSEGYVGRSCADLASSGVCDRLVRCGKLVESCQ